MHADALKRDLCFHIIMGLDMIGLLVHGPTLETLMNLTWSELMKGMNSGSFRDVRPEQDSQLVNSFAIDAEAELLDWMDEQKVDETLSTREALASCQDGEEGLLLLMKWASPGQWEVWEGRAFLYLEVALKREVDDIHELYTESVWNDVHANLTGMASEEYSERVVLNWMERRKALGESLDEKDDPKIVPTFEAHTRASTSLVYAINLAAEDHELQWIVGREHLEAIKWGHGAWNLKAFLHSP